MSRRRSVVRAGLLAAALAAGPVACAAPERTPVVPTTAGATATAAATGAPATPTGPAAATCSPPATATYAPLAPLPPPSALPAGSLEAQIRARGRLVVGVSADTRLLGARNLTTNQLEGFDVEVARRVAQAILGDPSKVQFRAISASQRVPLVQAGASAGGVDLVARAMTMTCDRWGQVAFAGPYFTSYLRVLVGTGNPATSLADAGRRGQRICATEGSTTLARVRATPGAVPVAVPLSSDCLVQWQQGLADAIAADDAILAGLAAQDPAARIVGDDSVESEPYGLAIARDHPEFVRFVNAVLDGMRGGDWQRAYVASGLAAVLQGRAQPAADYSRPVR